MHSPTDQTKSLVEALSRPAVVLLRLVFFVLIFYLLLSVAAGLLMPGQEYGRYTVQTEPAQGCADLERDLHAFNTNQVDFRVTPLVDSDAVVDGHRCRLELAGVSEAGVSAAAAPVYEAARAQSLELRYDESIYQPRHGVRETQVIWLLSVLLGAVVLVLRPRRSGGQDGRRGSSAR